MRQPAPDPAELRRVECRHVDHGDAHAAPIVEQLRPQRFREALDRVLGGAVGGLQRDGPVRQPGAHLDDGARVARQHVLERGQRAVDVAEIGDFGDPAVLLGTHLLDRRKDADHGVVDPHVDGTQLALDPLGRCLDGRGIGDVRRERERPSSGVPDLALRRREPVRAAGDQPHDRSARAECPGDGPSQSR